MNFEAWFTSHHPRIPLSGAQAVLRLAEEGATVPFIARYRKEMTGNLDEVAIQDILDAKQKWDQLAKRRQHILEQIERQNKLTPELREQIEKTTELEILEDLYLPFKLKRKTKAAAAKDAGLQPLADWVWNCGHGTETPEAGQTLELWALTFRNEAAEITTAEQAIQGALDILTERLADTPHLRQGVRRQAFEEGGLIVRPGPKVKSPSKYEPYFAYQESTASLLKPAHSHRYLALRRGWMEGELTVKIGGQRDGQEGDDFHDRLLAPFLAEACTHPDSPGAELLREAAKLALKAYVLPAIENEVHQAIKTGADAVAIQVFNDNLRKLLLAAPFGSKKVLGVDPGIRTGSKWALVDDTGKLIVHGVLHLQSTEGKDSAEQILSEIVRQAEVKAIAVGNGTGGRVTEQFLRDLLKKVGLEAIPVVMVNEAGASVYSASAVAREEFADLDISIRGAVSIARRLQDPLAELVKIDPRSIGVGQYQHDVASHALKKSLAQVVDSCVNGVGVNLNTASESLLSHVAGIGSALAKALVEFRSTRGLFESRNQLLEVPHFTTKTFEQAAGFLRIPGASHPLDNTGVHPERYAILEQRAENLGKGLSELVGEGAKLLQGDEVFRESVGNFTYEDILRELERPGRDPRDAFQPFHFREDIHEVADLQPNMLCPGIVTNVTSFGAFVDIGVHQDGLVHLSQLSGRFVNDARDVVSPGDRVQVRVLAVNLEKKQISLSMKPEEAPRRQTRDSAPRPRPEGQRRDPRRGKGFPERSSRPAPRPKPVFNNAFAELANLRTQLKPKK